MLAPRVYDAMTDRRMAERERIAVDATTAELRNRWRLACERPALGLSHVVATTLGGVNPGRMPRLHDIRLGSLADGTPCTFVVELPPGLILADLEDASQELAAALCVHRIAFDQLSGNYARATLVQHDPHAAVVRVVPEVAGVITLGPDENGEPIRVALAQLPHTACQGSSGFGKSTFLYWVLSQLVSMPGVRISGIDPSGLIFRPMPSDPWRVSGLRSIPDIVCALESLVAEMDERIARIPWDTDSLPCGPDEVDPWLCVVLEELPGLLVSVDSVDAKTAKYVRGLISRLAAEGRKAGVKLIQCAQRFDSNSTAGAGVRNNCGLRISFKVEGASTVQFLHDDATADQVAEHTHAEPGIALVTLPGRELERVRFPVVSYAEWAAAARASAGPGLVVAA